MADTDIDINSTTRGFLLRMGNAWIEQGELRQAIDVYLKITEQYPNSDESKAAKAALLTIAQRYEQEGQLRLSLDVLERLEQTIE
jgi:tetratricopeptide (TPR) repeat protein